MKKLILTALALAITSTCVAKTVTLHEKPNKTSKAVGKIDTNVGMITIYTPKKSEWIKVADPRNGNVGWVKASDVSATGFSFNMFSTGDGKHGYHVIQYGGSKPYSEKDMQKMVESMRKHQEALQKDMQHMMNDMFTEFNHMPMLMPIIVTKEKPVNAPKKQTKKPS